MKYYKYDLESSIVIEEVSEDYFDKNKNICCKTEYDFDIILYNIVLKLLNTDKLVLQFTKLPKTNSELIEQIGNLRKENEERFSDIEGAIAELYGGGE